MSNVTPDLEQRILRAAENDDENLMDLLQEAIESIGIDNEEQRNLLLDKVHQIQKEGLREIRGWRTDE